VEDHVGIREVRVCTKIKYKKIRIETPKTPLIVMPNYQFFLVSLVLVLERWGLVSFSQVKFCLESWEKGFQPQKDMVILNSIPLIS
jgi:hypothetical protein